MGWRNKKYQKSLKEQLNEKLTAMLKKGVGTSKKEAIATDTAYDKIFSYNSYKTYFQHCKYFINWIEENHPECKNLHQCKRYVAEWLTYRAELKKTDKYGNILKDGSGNPIRKYSAWTLQTEAKALGKLYGIRPDDKQYFHAPKRNRSDITRSRGDKVRDAHFSEKNHDELVKFCKGTGLRRNVLKRIKGSDFFTREQLESYEKHLETLPKTDENDTYIKIALDALGTFPDQQYFIYSSKDKNGRSRFSPIVGKNVDQIVARMQNTKPEDKVWEFIPNGMDVHGYRADYVTTIYRMYARPIEDIPYDRVNKGTGKRYQSGVYYCRGEEKGKKLDKDAMEKASKAAGHNRREIVARHYIRGL